MSTIKPFLKMQNISKNFGEINVLENINLSLSEGEILGLIGENGAGKSTLMKILFGMNEIIQTGGYKGEIFINGKQTEITSPFIALNAGIGMVHQEFSLIPGFSVSENILLGKESTKHNFLVNIFGKRLRTLDRAKMSERSNKAISLLGVNIDGETIISEMPVGHKQFTEIARELCRENIKLLILDEPTAVLTESEALVLLNSLKELKKRGISIIIISHRLQEILDITDKIIVLRDGKLVKELLTPKTSYEEITELMVGRKIEKTSHQKKVDQDESTIFSVKNLSVDMPGEKVQDVSFEVKKGEIFGIGGLAGQGKLGIPNGIMGYYPSKGKINFNGKDIELNNPLSPLNSSMAFVSEDRKEVGLLLDETIGQNISFSAMQTKNDFLKPLLFGAIKWRDDKKIRQISKKYINELQIKCVDETQKAGELSGGNQQKVCLAKAFTLNPDLLIVSEPTRGIDIGAKKIVLDTLKDHNKNLGTTIIVISSELEELRSVCDRIAIVTKGEVAGTLDSNKEAKEFGLLMTKI